jgi:hypothetical protein
MILNGGPEMMSVSEMMSLSKSLMRVSPSVSYKYRSVCFKKYSQKNTGVAVCHSVVLIGQEKQKWNSFGIQYVIVLALLACLASEHYLLTTLASKHIQNKTQTTFGAYTAL